MYGAGADEVVGLSSRPAWPDVAHLQVRCVKADFGRDAVKVSQEAS